LRSQENAMNSPLQRNPSTQLVVRGAPRWGLNVVLGENCRHVEIGFGAFIGDNVYIDVEELRIGDYFTLHQGSVIHGKRCSVGHNTWVGQYCILDALGGELRLGNNVGVGAHSQLWSHMKFGDVLEGCRWQQFKSLIVGDDVWFVGHCIVTPIVAEARSMLMVGGVATKDMAANHTYAGSPARDVTEKLGPQFREGVTLEEKQRGFAAYIEAFAAQGHDTGFIRACTEFPVAADGAHSWFNLATREYWPRYSNDERAFMRFLLYDRAKFVPRGSPRPA
jgi:acetyltransferase-like isoleucine patch superfamily enzyme